jgi:hypothetical protein
MYIYRCKLTDATHVITYIFETITDIFNDNAQRSDTITDRFEAITDKFQIYIEFAINRSVIVEKNWKAWMSSAIYSMTLKLLI